MPVKSALKCLPTHMLFDRSKAIFLLLMKRHSVMSLYVIQPYLNALEELCSVFVDFPD